MREISQRRLLHFQAKFQCEDDPKRPNCSGLFYHGTDSTVLSFGGVVVAVVVLLFGLGELCCCCYCGGVVLFGFGYFFNNRYVSVAYNF